MAKELCLLRVKGIVLYHTITDLRLKAQVLEILDQVLRKGRVNTGKGFLENSLEGCSFQSCGNELISAICRNVSESGIFYPS